LRTINIFKYIEERNQNMKYGMSDLIKAFREPYLGMREMNKVYHTRFGRYNYFPKGVDVFEQKWDNLIILDACRYDIFKEEYNLPGELEYRISRASMSKEFINGNFSNKKHHDTVYLSGNSWYARKCREINAELHEFELIKAEGKEYYIEKPKMITEEAIKADDEYPNKRLIVHYMLPHFPYIGPTARQTFPDIETQRETLFRDLRRGNADISDEQLKEAYRENLDIVLHMIENYLMNLLDGL
jgi:hypothetical protein